MCVLEIPIFLYWAFAVIRDQVVSWEPRGETVLETGDRGMLTQQPCSTCFMLIPGLCAGDPTWPHGDRSLVLRELGVMVEGVGRLERWR